MIVVESDALGRVFAFVVGCFITVTTGYLSFRLATDREFGYKYDSFAVDCIALAFLIGIAILGVCIVLWSLGWLVVK